jgi:hypothetical protein
MNKTEISKCVIIHRFLNMLGIWRHIQHFNINYKNYKQEAIKTYIT